MLFLLFGTISAADYIPNPALMPILTLLLLDDDGDGDGLPDDWEYQYFGNLEQGPNDDPDGDLLTNLQEYVLQTDPTDYEPDTDGDGMEDWWELAYFNSIGPDSGDDNDLDLLTNEQEYLLQTNPALYNADTDNDDLADWWELQYFNELSEGRNGDADGDGYSNYQEFVAKSNPDLFENVPAGNCFFDYDASGRLKGVVDLSDIGNAYEMEFNYDDIGNRTVKTVLLIQS